MSVLIVTSLGDIVVDLYADKCPLTCKNFLKLCKIKYYNGCLFHTVQKDFTAQTGDPTGTGAGGDSVYKFLYGDQARFFSDEIHFDLKHSKMGTVAMASAGENLNASQFYFTLRDDLDYLDGKHTVFGEIAEGLETLTRINEAYVDENNRPFKNIRIKHAYILDDPFDDPSQLAEMIPEASPEGKPKDEVDGVVRLEDDWVPMDEQLGAAELEEILRAKEAHSSAVVLESIGDIPDAETKPPDNVLFVCKLNPVTEDEDLHTIFSRFGTVTCNAHHVDYVDHGRADIIRDYKTGDSLCYAFIEFETNEACEQAYFKMDNALIDDRRIHVDFSGKTTNRVKEEVASNVVLLIIWLRIALVIPASTHQPSKYILKDDNMQRGGDNNSRYEMVFDGDTPESPRQGKRHGHHDPDYQIDREKKDGKERYKQSDRDRRHIQDTRYPESKGGSRYPEERLDKEKYMDRRKDRDDRDYRKRSSDSQRDHDSHKDHRDYRKRTSDGHRDHDGHKGKRDEREHRRRGAENDDDPEHDRDRRNRDDKRSRALR
ncbi:PEPTIDYL-PROLYL CIS-TRANS ISOMERASE-LIKE 4 [Salix viminalis]|uniref:Peptidyl-prolyl cis-trans isomerase n=1 Tax=Salix viminalis TaxID=40686 RepID=A0A9Q0UVI3_SALVM|nr:PEPTIDYL-PROLYL CIS-TRANS ISOMERASE-LIKE 4 [Salix viminalis]